MIAAALALAPALAIAQGYGPRQGYGPGMGYGQGTGRGMMGGGYGGGLATLDLSDEQAQKIFAIQEAARKKNWETMNRVRAEMFKSHLETRKQIEAVLTPEQRKKFKSFGPGWMQEESE